MPKKKHHRSHGGSNKCPPGKRKQAAAAAAAAAAENVPDEAAEVGGAAPSTEPAAMYGQVLGLDNLGNTCFFNSVLQMLQAAPQLEAYYAADGDELVIPDGPLGEGLRELFLHARLDRTETSQTGRFKTSTCSPKQLLSAVCEIAPQFKGRQQHDSHEVLRCLLDGLQNEEEKLSKAKSDLMQRASDVEEGLVFRQLSSSQRNGSSFAALMADANDISLADGDPRASAVGLTNGESGNSVQPGTELQLNPAESENDSMMPESADLFDEDNCSCIIQETANDQLAALASDARHFSQRLLRRVLSAPASARSDGTLAADFAAPAREIAEASAENLLQSAMLSAKADVAADRRLRRVQSEAIRPGSTPKMPLIQEDDESEAEAATSMSDGSDGGTHSTVDWFSGELSSSINCEGCCFVSTSREPFLDLSLPVPWSTTQLNKQTRSRPKAVKARPSSRTSSDNAKESKRLLKEAKKKEKQERRRSVNTKHGSEFELVLTAAQQAEEALVNGTCARKEPCTDQEQETCTEETPDGPAGIIHEGHVLLLPSVDGEGGGQEDSGGPAAAEVEHDQLLESLDALSGCDMEAQGSSDSGDRPETLPDWNPDDEAFSIFGEQETCRKDRDEEVSTSREEVADMNVLGCLSCFFKPEHIEWECPQESGKLSAEDEGCESSSNHQKPAVQSVCTGKQLGRRVSFAGYGGSVGAASSQSSKKRVVWSKEMPDIFKIPGSEEQRGTDLLEAMKGNATFNKPFKYSGNDFIVRVRLDAWSGDRLDVLVGPNWDDDAEDMWPDEQKVADVQIDPIEDPSDEASQDLLKLQAQLLLDCFSDLFICQGPHGMLNILRAGYPQLDEKPCADGSSTRWVVMGRFPPGQIGGAKVWYYPPDSDASAGMFSSMGGESPSTSPKSNAPLPQKISRGELKSSLKKPQFSDLAAELKELSISHSLQPHGGVAASPPIAHFPPNATFPHESADDCADSGGGDSNDLTPPDRTMKPEVFQRTEVDSLQPSAGSALTVLMNAETTGTESAMATGEAEPDHEETTKLACALASGDGANYVRRARKDPGVTGADEISEDAEPARGSVDGDAAAPLSVHQPTSTTSKKGGLKKCVQRTAIKRYQIHRAPDLLTIHLKRFQQDLRGRLEKIGGSVPFDFHLDLSSFCDPVGSEKNGARYELLGVVVHSGTLRGGHYVAYVRRTAKVLHAHNDVRFPPKWYYVSDSVVKPVDSSEVLACEAYMLLYNRLP